MLRGLVVSLALLVAVWVPGDVFAQHTEVFNVKAPPYNALGNGMANDTAAIVAAYAAIPATGGILYFPPGRYLVDYIPLTKSHVTWLGAGPTLSILQTTVENTYATVVAAIPFTNVTFDSLGLDGNNTAYGWYADDPSRNGILTMRNCRFTRFTSWSVYINAPHFVLDRNEFEGDGTTATQGMQGIILASGASYGKITNNTFRYIKDGMFGKAGGINYPSIEHGEMTSYVEFSGNVGDLGVYTKIARGVGSGAGVSYTLTTLTHAGATFTGFATNDFIRVMPLRASGTATIEGTQLTDASKNFAALGVLPGEIVRLGGRMGIITALEAVGGTMTTLHVEEWLSETDRSRVGAPASGLSYEVWGIYLGKYWGHTADTISVGRWMTLNGADVTPANGTRYELLPRNPNYAFHCEYSCQHWQITNNTILRPYSDGLSWYGSYGVIANNIVGWGQDVGITINGLYNLVNGNRITHQGTMGIACDKCSDCVISNNSITDTTWENKFDGWLAGITVASGDRNILSNNSIGIDTPDMPQARYGIAVAGNAANTLLIGNSTRNHGVGGIRLDHAGGVVANTYTLNNISINETAVSTSGPTYLSSPVALANPITTVAPTAPNRTIALTINGVTLYVPAKTTND